VAGRRLLGHAVADAARIRNPVDETSMRLRRAFLLAAGAILLPAIAAGQT
jgi:hypothetical protein